MSRIIMLYIKKQPDFLFYFIFWNEEACNLREHNNEQKMPHAEQREERD